MELKLNGKNGGTVLYSPEDHDIITRHVWSYKEGYAVSTINSKTVRMHRLITKCQKNFVVDHINGNSLDNRRENLRIVSSKENGRNKRKRLGTSSPFLGVQKTKNGYRAYINHDGKKLHIGSYSTEEEAANARDIFILQKLPDSCYKLNFPEKKDINMKVVFVEKKQRTKITTNQLVVKSFCKNVINNPSVVQLLIPTKPESVVLIDRQQYDNLKYYSYWINGRGYVQSSKSLLHRFIMNEQNPEIFIDHIDGNKLNNTISNLRKSDAANNSQNRKKTMTLNTTSKFIGVSFEKSTQKWKASIRANGKDIFIGRFDNETLAALERDKYILVNLPGSHYKLNFPTNV